jgi:uncharacterized membrane protein YfcA
MTPAWLVVFLAIFLIGVTKSGFGSGVGLMIVPMTVMALGRTSYGSQAALGLMLPLLIAGDLIAVWQYRRLFSPDVVKKLLPGTAAGVVLGGLLLWWFHRVGGTNDRLLRGLIKVEVAFESIVLVALHWWRVWRGQALHVDPTPLRSTLTGAAAGVSSTLAHAAGPIIALYLLPQKLERQLFVGTCAVYFFLLNTAKLPAYWGTHMFSRPVLWLSLYTLPLVAAGAVFGFWVNRKLNDELFSKIVYVLTFLLGWWLLYDGIRDLLSR